MLTHTFAIIGALVVGQVSDIEECRRRHGAFDADNVVVACQAVADDARQPASTRVEALRILAIGHALRDDEAPARLAYRRMLTLDHRARPGSDAGPRFERIFAGAKRSVLDDGRVRARVRADPGALVADVDDPLGRVARVVVRTSTPGELIDLTEDRSPSAAETHDIPLTQRTFRGAVDEREPHVVEFVGHAGAVIVSVRWRPARAGAEAALASADEPPAPLASTPAPSQLLPDAVAWTFIGTGALAIVGGAVVGGTTVHDVTNRVPCGLGARCMPQALMFGLYSGPDRQDFLNEESGGDWSAWLTGAVVAVGAGGVLAIVGLTIPRPPGDDVGAAAAAGK